MTLDEFHQAILAAFKQYAPGATVSVAASRGLVLTCKAELNADTFIAIYFNALTGKTSYALIHNGRRFAGCDNYKFWHRHPAEDASQHVVCAEPTPEQAIAELVEAGRRL